MARPVRKTMKGSASGGGEGRFLALSQGGCGSGDSNHPPWQAGGHSDRLESEDDWLEYRLGERPAISEAYRQSRASLRAGRGVPLEEVE